jgi:hypothetical protein
MLARSLILPATVFAGVFLGGCNGPSISGTFTSCLEKGQCDDVEVRAAGSKVPAAALKNVLTCPTVQAAWKLIDRSTDLTDQEGRRHLEFTAMVDGKAEVVESTLLTSDSKNAVSLGVTLVKLFTLAARKKDPSRLKLGQIFSAVADKFEELVPVLKANGIDRIDVSYVRSVDIDDAVSTLRKLGEVSAESPYLVRRPG